MTQDVVLLVLLTALGLLLTATARRDYARQRSSGPRFRRYGLLDDALGPFALALYSIRASAWPPTAATCS